MDINALTHDQIDALNTVADMQARGYTLSYAAHTAAREYSDKQHSNDGDASNVSSGGASVGFGDSH